MTDQKSTFTNAFESTVPAGLDATAMSLIAASVSGLDDTFGFWLVIEPDEVAQREYLRFGPGSISGTTLTISARYLAGSAAGSGLVHPNDSVLRMSSFAQAFEDLHDRIDADAAAAITDHGALSGKGDDDHSQYLNESRHDADDHSGVNTDHGALTGLEDDDHPNLLNTSRHTALSGDHVTNGDSHDHTGGEGAQIDHGGLAGLADDDHPNLLSVARHDADDHSGLLKTISIGEPGSLAASKSGTIRWYPPENIDVQAVTISLGAGTITVDVHRSGTTIFTSQGNRPQISSGNFDRSGTPDGTTTLTKDSHYLTFDWESATGAEDLLVTVEYLAT